MTADMLERMAARSIKPVTPTKTKNDSGFDPNDKWWLQTGSAPTPQRTGDFERAIGAAANVPGNKPFTGPTLDPDIIGARAGLDATATAALAAGLDKATVEALRTTGEDPNRGFLGIGRKILNLDVIPGERQFQPIRGVGKVLNVDVIPGQKEFRPLTTLGKAGLQAVAPVAEKIDLGYRLVSSTLKETGDALRGIIPGADASETGRKGKTGFSIEDWWNQTFAGEFGLGDKYKADDPEIIAQAQQLGGTVTPQQLADYLNREQRVGYGEFVQDLRYPGSTYGNQLLGFLGEVVLSPETYLTGPGSIAKTAVQRTALKGAGRTARLVEEAIQQSVQATIKKKLAQEAFDVAKAAGDAAAQKTATATLRAAEKELAAAAKVTASKAAPRTLGIRSNIALAQNAQQIADDAADFLARTEPIVAGRTLTEVSDAVKAGVVDDIVDAGFDPNTFLGQLADARATVAALDDVAIANISKSGLAGIAGSYMDILRGNRTAAQEVLGVRGGLRFGVGTAKVGVPGTERAMNLLGKGVSDLRILTSNNPVSNYLLNKITLTTEGGIWTADDVLAARRAIRRGAGAPEDIANYLRALQLNDMNKAFFGTEAKAVTGVFNKYGINQLDRDTVRRVIPFLQTDEALWKRIPTPEEKVVYDAIRGALDELYGTIDNLAGRVGFEPGFVTNYFPMVQSPRAVAFMKTNSKEAEKLAKQLKVDRSWFLGNFNERTLKEGDVWFGHKLEPEDLNVETLNDFARNPVGDIKGLKFDFFEADPFRALRIYGDKHARYAAYLRTLGDAPLVQPKLFGKGTTVEKELLDEAGNIIYTPGEEALPVMTKKFVNEVKAVPTLAPKDIDKLVGELGLGGTTATGAKTPGRLSIEALAAATPDELAQVLSAAKKVTEQLSRPKVIKQSFLDDFDTLLKELDSLKTISETRFAGMTPDEQLRVIKEIQDGVKLEARRLMDELSGKIPSTFPRQIDHKKWVEWADAVDEGYGGLNPETLPDLGAKRFAEDLLTNATRVRNEAFANKFTEGIRAYTQFAKSWLVLRPGFYLRNAYSNAFQFLVAGGNPAIMPEAMRLANKINKKLGSGMSVREAAESLVDEIVKDSKALDPLRIRSRAVGSFQQRAEMVQAVEDAIQYSSSVGFGQFGEVAEALTERVAGGRIPLSERGVFGSRARIPFTDKRNYVSQFFGQIPAAGRKAGTKVEDAFRFSLMWDGISKGLTPQEAIARVNKYLLDYQEFSKVDKVMRMVFPFWTFMSRNAPLQFELLLTNPKFYGWYGKFKEQLEDKTAEMEGRAYLENWQKERGEFITKEEGFGKLLPGRTFIPNLPFEGAGESTLSDLIERPKEFIANINPLFRAPVETLTVLLGDRPFEPELGQFGGRGYKSFGGFPVVSRGDVAKGLTVQKSMQFLFNELFATSSPLKSIVAALPEELRPGLLRSMLGITIDENEPELQEMIRRMGWLGLPFGDIRTAQQKRALEKRMYALARKIDEKQNSEYYKQKEELEKQQEQIPDTPFDPNEKWWLNP